MRSVILRRLMFVFSFLLAEAAASELAPAPLLPIRDCRDLGSWNWGFMDRTGKVVVKPSYELVGPFCENRALVSTDGTHYGYIGPNGTVLIKPTLMFNLQQADNARWLDFSEGLAPYYANVRGDKDPVLVAAEYQCHDPGQTSPWIRCGYIDTLGKTVIQPQYGCALPFQGGLAAASDCTSGKWGFIDKAGVFVVTPQFDDVGEFSQGLAPVEIGGQWGFVDTVGRVVVMPLYDDVAQFSEGLAEVTKSGVRGYISRAGGMMVDDGGPVIAIDDHSDGLIPVCVRIDTGWGYVDTLGKTVISPRYSWAKPFCEGLGRVSTGGDYSLNEGFHGGKWGYVRRDGSLAVRPAYDDAEDFSEGLAAVRVQDRWGYIDTLGAVVVQPQFDKAEEFVNGRATVQLAGKQGCINRSGQVVIKPEFDFVDYPQEGMIRLNIGGRLGELNLCESGIPGGGQWGYADTLGRIIVMPRFDYGERFSGGIAKVSLGGTLGYERFGYIDAAGRSIWSPSE